MPPAMTIVYPREHRGQAHAAPTHGSLISALAGTKLARQCRPYPTTSSVIDDCGKVALSIPACAGRSAARTIALRLAAL